MLNGKIAIVTGGAMNIGKAIAAGLAGAGANIVIADINLNAAEETARELSEKFGVSTLAVEMDVTEETSRENLIKTVIDRYGKIDILCNNAGVQLKKLRLEDLTEEEWDVTMNINNKGMVFLTKLVAEKMKENGGGKIINTSSINQMICSQDNMCYIISKNTVGGITKQLAVDLAPYNINVNAVAPGYINTRMNAVTFSIPGRIEQICKSIPLGRIAEPEELAGTFVFLADSASDYVTGQVVYVDGGFTLL